MHCGCSTKQQAMDNEQWPVLDVRSVCLLFFAVTQWRPEPSLLMGMERIHKAERFTYSQDGNTATLIESPLHGGESWDTVNFQQHRWSHEGAWVSSQRLFVSDDFSFCKTFNASCVCWQCGWNDAVCSTLGHLGVNGLNKAGLPLCIICSSAVQPKAVPPSLKWMMI